MSTTFDSDGSNKGKRLKIAFLCETDPYTKPWGHSGGHVRLLNTLNEHVGDVTYLGESWGSVDFVRRLIQKLPTPIKLRLQFRVHWALSFFIAKQIRKQLKKEQYDVLFCCYGFYCLSQLKLPYSLLTVFTSDATFTVYKYSEVGEQFNSFFSLSRFLDPLLKKSEKKVYEATDLLLWPSNWMRDSVNDLFNVSPNKSHMVPWGANILPPAAGDLIAHDLAKAEQVELLLVGRDWYPKGGPTVYQVLLNLLSAGIKARLTVVGCTPPDEFAHDQVRVYSQLNKDIKEEYETFISLYKTAHFFVMPSHEAYGFAFCEASAYGLPSLCLNVGGVPIKEGVNGHALPRGSQPDNFVEKIQYYIANPAEYHSLRESTRQYYEEHLNWPAWANKVSQLINEKRQKS